MPPGTPTHLWYSGRYRPFGADVQFSGPADEVRPGVFDALPCSTHDSAVDPARQVTGVLNAADQVLPVLVG